MPLTPQKSESDISSRLPPTPEATPELFSTSLKRRRPSDIETSPSAGRSNKRLVTESANLPSTKVPAPVSATSPTSITPSSRRYLFPPTPSPTSTSTFTTTTTPTKPTSNPSTRPKSSLFHKPSHPTPKPKPLPSVSAIELKHAAESILRQVDWDEVAAYVASNRRGRVYKTVVKGMLQERVDGLFEKEGRLEAEGQGAGDGEG